MNASPHIVLVAGEPSGDNLGAQLIESLRELFPSARFSGIAGPKMRAVGCVAWEASESLAIMGILEVLPQLPRLLRLRRALINRVIAERADIYVGVDFKEFNLNVARKLKARGVRTVQYVSPQVWAWRQGRARKIAAAVDAVLCLLPFEKSFYDSQPPAFRADARFVGHPLADRIPLTVDRKAARESLKIDVNSKCVALLPGSRRGEVARLAQDFAATVRWLITQQSDLTFVAAMANPPAREMFVAALRAAGVESKVKIVDGQSQAVLIASDAVLLASGTATLEALLCKRPMVVVYRLDRLTTFLLRNLKLMKAPFFAQPNLLAGRQVVPEYFNEQVRAEVLGPAVLEQLNRPDRAELEAAFSGIHQTLRRDASRQAAAAIRDRLMIATPSS